MAISRVLRPARRVAVRDRRNRAGKPTKRNCSHLPEAERLAAGRQFMSSENQALLREQAAKSVTKSHQTAFPEDFVYDFVAPVRVTALNSASTTKRAAFANSRRATEIKKSCRTFVGLISTPTQRAASAWRGHNLGWRRKPLRFPILAASARLKPRLGRRRCVLRIIRVAFDMIRTPGPRVSCRQNETGARPLGDGRRSRRRAKVRYAGGCCSGPSDARRRRSERNSSNSDLSLAMRSRSRNCMNSSCSSSRRRSVSVRYSSKRDCRCCGGGNRRHRTTVRPCAARDRRVRATVRHDSANDHYSGHRDANSPYVHSLLRRSKARGPPARRR